MRNVASGAGYIYLLGFDTVKCSGKKSFIATYKVLRKVLVVSKSYYEGKVQYK